MAKTLTDIAIRNLKPGVTRREIPDPGARGLYIVIQKSGRKGFAVRYRYAGKPRKLTLQAGISLAAARKAAADALYELEKGHDPSGAKKTAQTKAATAAATTLRSVAEQYWTLKCGMRRDGDRVAFTGPVRTAARRLADCERLIFPVLGNRPIAEIRRSDIVRLLDKIQIQNGPVMADRVLAIIRSLLNWYATRSDDFRSPVVRGMARIDPKERARSRTLTDDEIRAVWRAADQAVPPFGAFVQFLLLTAARRGEAAQMAWDEVSETDWVLPAPRNKARLDLVRPLSAAAREIITKLPRLASSKFVFTIGGREAFNSFSRAKAAFDTTCGVTGWTLHDLRRTARSLMSRAGVDADHAERCLGHVIGGVRGVYDRHEFYSEKKLAFEKLAAQIERIVNPQPNVVPMVRG